MKNLRLISTKTVSLLTLFLMVISLSTNAQTTKKTAMMKDCCMMKDGKMMVMKDGKTMPMEKDMVMENGTTCMTNGECIMKDGTKMMMKNGDCMEMSGKMCTDKMKHMSKTKTTKKMATMEYSCPMHHEVTSDKPGKCSKCGMDLVKKG
jgi:Heavy metal binding domain